ncbi:MAG: hypothetical protein ABW168_25225 [Sedimenticola sp.]
MNKQEKGLLELGNDYQYNDFDEIGSLSWDYFDKRSEFHKLDKVIKASESREARKIDGRAEVLKKIHGEFSDFVKEICDFYKLKPIFENALNRMIQDKNGDRILEDTLPTLEAYLRRYKKKLFRLFFKFRKQLPMDYQLQDLLEDAFYPRIEGRLRTWLKRNTALAILDEDDQNELITRFMGFVRQIIQKIMNELEEVYPALFNPESGKGLAEKGEEREEISAEASGLKRRLLMDVPGLDELLDYVKEHRKSLSLTVLRQLLKRLMKVIAAVLRKNIPENPDYPSRKRAADLRSLEQAFERVFKKKLGILDSPAPASPARRSHKCGAALMSHSGRCKRRTTNNNYCFQHKSRVPSGDALLLAGKWRMTGKQDGVPRSGWRADLVLRKNGRLKWKQTAGANIGAKRNGRWMFADGIFTMVYRAPKVGWVEWRSRKMRVGSKSMGGTYDTPQVAIMGKGWGGGWRATRIQK